MDVKLMMMMMNLIMKFFLVRESSHLGISKLCARLRRLCELVLTFNSREQLVQYMIVIGNNGVE